MGVLFTFPSRYSFAIGLTGVFSLAGWARLIRAGLLVSRVTQDTARPRPCSCTGLSPSVMQLSRCFHSTFECHNAVLLPPRCVATPRVWAVPRSLATTGGITVVFPPFASVHICTDNYPSGNWVVPFGNPRINGYLLLPGAYRSLSRPSSPP